MAAAAAAGILACWFAAATGEEGPVTADDLLGSWSRASGDACAAIYPPRIELKAQNVYLAPDGPSLGSVWHGGGWRLEGETLVVEAANDAERRYRILDAAAGELTLLDERDCRVTWRRG